MSTALRGPDLDLIICSPDGESRSELFRVGDLFPMDPTGHILMAPGTAASEARPWGLRFRQVPQPRAGKHESGATSEVSTSNDGTGPEETQSD
ncbi:hypothetical protein [Actinocorallia sp. A-T 12471]|uniref:hypothetical protein n=1 Tax=Actinocorallia sp. A-T 12471 TaxID=3089813 RepID=UPI0029CE339E|nr:hypothetical protein [Actinocorallia sp. A-T 12471]MDX6745094.1 hypothetical protein [Actinocorallia sp. A-T 12471]